MIVVGRFRAWQGPHSVTPLAIVALRCYSRGMPRTETRLARYAQPLTVVLSLAVADGHLTPRPDGRFDVTDSEKANARYGCKADDWCILQDGHAGSCDGDRCYAFSDAWHDPYALCRGRWADDWTRGRLATAERLDSARLPGTVVAFHQPVTTEMADAVAAGLLTPRPDGRFDVTLTTPEWRCPGQDTCILNLGHVGRHADTRSYTVTPDADPYAGCRTEWAHQARLARKAGA